MNKFLIEPQNSMTSETLETASDRWLQQWVEENTNDFASVDLDDFILID